MNVQLIITLINVAGMIFVAILSFMNRKAIHQVHVDLNSRLTELIEVTRKEAHAKGVQDAIDDPNIPTNDIISGRRPRP